jgi:hypothetical protein
MRGANPGFLGQTPRGSSALADPEGWRIEIRPVALKSLRKLSRNDRERIRIAIGQLPDRDANASGAQSV